MLWFVFDEFLFFFFIDLSLFTFLFLSLSVSPSFYFSVFLFLFLSPFLVMFSLFFSISLSLSLSIFLSFYFGFFTLFCSFFFSHSFSFSLWLCHLFSLKPSSYHLFISKLPMPWCFVVLMNKGSRKSDDPISFIYIIYIQTIELIFVLVITTFAPTEIHQVFVDPLNYR